MKKYGSIILLMAMFIVAARLAAAQERGQYPAGFRGLNAAEQPAPGFTYANYIYWYPSDTFKDKDGRTTALNFDLDLVAYFNLLAYTPKKKFLGATFSSLVIVPITNVAITLPRLGRRQRDGNRRHLRRACEPSRIYVVTADVSGKMIQDTEEENKAFARAAMARQ